MPSTRSPAPAPYPAIADATVLADDGGGLRRFLWRSGPARQPAHVIAIGAAVRMIALGGTLWPERKRQPRGVRIDSITTVHRHLGASPRRHPGDGHEVICARSLRADAPIAMSIARQGGSSLPLRPSGESAVYLADTGGVMLGRGSKLQGRPRASRAHPRRRAARMLRPRALGSDARAEFWRNRWRRQRGTGC